MKLHKFIIPLFVLLLAGVTMYLDIGLVGSGVTFAAGLPLMDLDFDSDPNLPGINKALIIPIEDIVTESLPIASPTTAVETITIDGDHALTTGKYFFQMYSTQGKGTLKVDAEGSRDFENFKASGSLFFPSTKIDALALATAFLGKDIMILLEENSQSDHYLQVGTSKFPARIVSNGDWGTELNGEKGITFNFETYHGKVPAYIYTGAIPLVDSPQA